MLIDFVSHPVVLCSALLIIRLLARLRLAEGSLYRFILDIVFFAALTGLLLFSHITPYLPDDLSVAMTDRIANGGLKAIWWLSAAMMLASLVRLFLILEGKPREARLLQDVAVSLIYICAAFCIIGYVFSLPIGTLVATSGVLAIVLGLALQNTLGDVFSGIALNLGRPISPGHWIILDDDVQGQVFETTWRSTQIRTLTNDVVFVPNSLLAKSRFTNTSYPDDSHGSVLTVNLALDRPPQAILAAMNDVLLSSNTILKSPAPLVTIQAIDNDFITVELAFRVAEIGQVVVAKNELFDLVYRHATSIGLRLASSMRSIMLEGHLEKNGEAARREDAPSRLLSTISLFSSLTAEEKDRLMSEMGDAYYAKGAVVARHGSTSSSLTIVRNGVIAVTEPTDSGTIELARIAPGDIFGERGVLLDAAEIGDKVALTAVSVYTIPKDLVAAIMKDRPGIAEEFARLMSDRSRNHETHHQSFKPIQHQGLGDLALRIRKLFRLERTE